MAEPAPLLSIQDLRLAFGGLQVLAGVSVSVGRGEILALVGPNGAGKTSLLNCVNGLYRPDAGRILYAGEEITGWPPHRVAGRGIARSFQLVELFRHMTVLDNLLLGRHIHMRTGIFTGGLYWGPGLREETVHRRAAEEVLDFLELGGYRRRPVASLPYWVQKQEGLYSVPQLPTGWVWVLFRLESRESFHIKHARLPTTWSMAKISCKYMWMLLKKVIGS